MMYNLTWDKPTFIEVGELQVPMPDMPPEREMKNYALKSAKQFYAKEQIPSGLKSKSKEELHGIAERQWHRRLNGEWQLIKGQPYYIPGPAVPFFDFWTLESGKSPDFRYSALTLFWAWCNFVERNENVFGLFDMKTRRIGDTANFLYLYWERVTRHRGVRGGMQSYKDEMAAKTFARCAKGARSMPYFFRPNRSGSEKEQLAYVRPSEVATMKSIKENDKLDYSREQEEFLGSYMDFQPTVNGAYDGEQLFMYFLDEVFKIAPFRMNAKEQWNNIKRCLSLFGESHVYGKAALCSTVEKKDASGKEEASSIDVANWFWENSDPSMLADSEDGRTVSGLVRLFRGYEDAARPDEWGFPMVEKARSFRKAKIAKAMKSGDPSDLHDIYRKEPASPGEALIEDNATAPLYPELCQLALSNLDSGLDRHGNPISGYRKPWAEGELVWANGRNTSVEFVPRAGGPWHISQMPIRPNHVQVREMPVRGPDGNKIMAPTFVPLNGALYRGGADPISSNPKILTRGSEGAICIERIFDPGFEEVPPEYGEHGQVLNPEQMATGQPVADYLFRPRSPDMYFEEIAKACFFYGMPIMLEMDKYEAYVWLNKHGYSGFVMQEPPGIALKRGRKSTPAPGVRASADIIGTYVTELQMYIAHWWPAIKHPRLLKEASRFTVAKRTKFDAVVAWGMCKIGLMDHRYAREGKSQEWAENPYA